MMLGWCELGSGPLQEVLFCQTWEQLTADVELW